MFEPFTLGVGSAALVGAGAGSAFTGIIWYFSSKRRVKLPESTKRLTFSEIVSRSNPLRESSLQHDDSAQVETTQLIESRLKNRTTKERRGSSFSRETRKSIPQVYEAILSFTLFHKGLYFQLVHLWEKEASLRQAPLLTCWKKYNFVAKLEFRKRPCWRKVCRKPLVELSATLLDEVETSTESVYAAVADLRNTECHWLTGERNFCCYRKLSLSTYSNVTTAGSQTLGFDFQNNGTISKY
ncbi:hypothetical protein Gasu2_39430 [Galdieria sulphuraria]|nr:hypothetical protein Gasu2_39430 [Galdieria sulphuraria]